MNAKQCMIPREDSGRALRGRNWDEFVGGGGDEQGKRGWSERMRKEGRCVVKKGAEHVEGRKRSQLQL